MRWIVLVLLVGVAIGVGLVLVLDDGDDDDGDVTLVERTAEVVPAAKPPEAVKLDDEPRLPPLNRRERSGETAPEEGRRTPISDVDPLQSSERPATDLQDPTDPRGTDDAFGLFANQSVDQGHANYIAEPSVASNGKRKLVVWNFGAAFSNDGGKTFEFVDPAFEFPRAAGGFCCDQVAYYVPGHDLWIWFLQYWPKDERNIVRIAVAKGNRGFDARRFRFYNISSRNFPGIPRHSDLDYPNLSATRRHLFLSINAFFQDFYERTVVMRIPLRVLAAGSRLRYEYVLSSSDTAEFTEGAKDTMYFAQHRDTSTLRVWRWADNRRSPEFGDVSHSSYPLTRGQPTYSCARTQSGAGDWCARLQDFGPTNDDRPTGGFISGDTLGFAWNALQSKERGFPYPFVMVVRINKDTLSLIDEPFIWHPRYAYQYAGFAPNARGDLGGAVLAGGGDRYQTCAALISDTLTQGTWEARAVDVSDSDPAEGKAGDYLGVTPVAPGANIWNASCMTLHGGGRPSDVNVRLFEFGRVRDR